MAGNNGNGANQGVMPPSEILEPPSLKGSVTAGDAAKVADPNATMLGLSSVYSFIARTYSSKLMPDLPAYWSRSRDFHLANTVNYDGLWESAISMAITQAASSSFDVEGRPVAVNRVQEMFSDANSGEGFEVFLAQHLQDYFLTDNGGFIEIVRVKDNPGARIIGFNHLDSMRCWRTGKPETPVYYQDLENRWHALKWYQVHAIADMPNPRSTYFGVGRCAAGRAYARIQRRVATQLYLNEKLNPTAPHTIAFANGINQEQLKQALAQHEIDRQKQGIIMYGGMAFIPTFMKDGVKIETVSLSELTPNFDSEVELNHDVYMFADALGLDPQDLKPLSGGAALGTGAQSQILDDKARGKGLVLWKKRFAKFVNHCLTPDGTRYFWQEYDLREELQKATLNGQIITNATSMVAGGLTTPALGTQYLVDEKVLGEEYLPGGVDVTPGVSMSDDEKPYMLDANAAPELLAQPMPAPMQPATAPVQGQPAPATPPAATMPATESVPATDPTQAQPVQSGEPGVSNVTVLEDDEPEDETDEALTKEAGKGGPGSRGGKYWIDPQGNVHYGPKPGYAIDRTDMSNLAPKQVRALNRRATKADLMDSTTGKVAANLDLMRSKGWSVAVGPGGGNDFGKGSAGKNAAVTEAENLAASNPDKMYVVALIKPGNTYSIVSKLINNLPPPPKPKKPDKTNNPVAANVGGAGRRKPKDAATTKEIADLADWLTGIIEAKLS